MKGWLYILKSEKSGRYYTGSTKNIERRLSEFHNQGKVKATRNWRPWILVYRKEYESIREARQAEYSLKKMKSRIILEKIIANNNLRIG